MNIKGIAIFHLAVLMSFSMFAQWNRNAEKSLNDSISKWDYHLSVGTGVMGNRDDARCYTLVAPSISYRPTDRWKINGGFGVMSDFGLVNTYKVDFSNTPSRVPLKQQSNTGIVAGYVAAEYQANEKLWLAASIFGVSGQYNPFFFGNGQSLPVGLYGGSASMTYKIGDDSFLHLSLHIINDNMGTLPFLYHDALMYSGIGCYGLMNPYYMHNPMGCSYLGWNY